jgi:malate/lactate dehydrogenase
MIQKRGGKILGAKGISSSISAANAIKDAIRDWRIGSIEITSMGIILEESVYGIPKDLCVSVPVMCRGNYRIDIIKDLQLNDFQKKKIKTTTEELLK